MSAAGMFSALFVLLQTAHAKNAVSSTTMANAFQSRHSRGIETRRHRSRQRRACLQVGRCTGSAAAGMAAGARAGHQTVLADVTDAIITHPQCAAAQHTNSGANELYNYDTRPPISSCSSARTRAKRCRVAGTPRRPPPRYGARGAARRRRRAFARYRAY
jgi:hypothetical protein